MSAIQSTTYKMSLFCAVFVLFSPGSLYCSTASATGGNEVNFDDVRALSEVWLLEGGGDSVDLEELRKLNDVRLLAEDGNDPNLAAIVSDVNVTPEGGIFELPGGLIVDIPAGAVSEETLFQTRLLDAEEVEPYLDIGQTKKRFISGVEIFSDGIAFNLPVSITLPMEPSEDPNNMSLPYLFYLNRDTGTLIPDLPIPAELSASSVLLANPIGKYFEVDCSKGQLAIRDLTEFPPEDWILVMAAMDKVLVHSDCVANPCRCCRFRVRSNDSDIVEDGLCTNYSSEGNIQYLDCEDQPTEGWSFKEKSIQITYDMIPDRRSILCDTSLTLMVELFDINDAPLENHTVQVTSSRPDLLQVTRLNFDDEIVSNNFVLQRIGDDVGVSNVLIDAGCEIRRTIPIQIGCEIPDLKGLWHVNGSETWWNCRDPEDNGVYPGFFTIEFDSQDQLSRYSASFGGTFEFTEFTEEYTMYYTERYSGTITVDCDVSDRCEYKVRGDTNYTERYFFPDGEPGDPPFIIRGIDTFSGSYRNGVMRLTTLGFDTKGDTCQSAGNVTLSR